MIGEPRGGASGARIIQSAPRRLKLELGRNRMPMWLQAGGWGALAGSALLLGATLGYRLRISVRLVAAVMAFGSGVLISALAFELVDEAYANGGLLATAGGFAAGALLYTVLNMLLARLGARHRKRSGGFQADERAAGDGGAAIALGALIDGIPESIVIGVSLLEGGVVSWVVVVAVFLSNVPEGLSSAAGMRRAGRSAPFVFGVWGAITLASALSALLGYLLFRDFSAQTIAAITAVAGGGILAMLADTMIPEAFEEAHDLAGLITAAGFLAAFTLSKLGGA
jgi:ZIP family zinc transporter